MTECEYTPDDLLRSFPLVVRRHQAIAQGDIVLTTDGTTYEITVSQRFEADG